MSPQDLPDLSDLTAEECKVARAALGVSQVRFADIMMISRRTVEEWEKRGAPARERFMLAAIMAGLKPWAKTPEDVGPKTGTPWAPIPNMSGTLPAQK